MIDFIIEAVAGFIEENAPEMIETAKDLAISNAPQILETIGKTIGKLL
jgi:hypothetical protein